MAKIKDRSIQNFCFMEKELENDMRSARIKSDKNYDIQTFFKLFMILIPLIGVLLAQNLLAEDEVEVQWRCRRCGYMNTSYTNGPYNCGNCGCPMGRK